MYIYIYTYTHKQTPQDLHLHGTYRAATKKILIKKHHPFRCASVVRRNLLVEFGSGSNWMTLLAGAMREIGTGKMA